MTISHYLLEFHGGEIQPGPPTPVEFSPGEFGVVIPGDGTAVIRITADGTVTPAALLDGSPVTADTVTLHVNAGQTVTAWLCNETSTPQTVVSAQLDVTVYLGADDRIRAGTNPYPDYTPPPPPGETGTGDGPIPDWPK